MPTAEFDRPAGRMPLSPGPPRPFPDDGLAEPDVLAAIRERLDENRYRIPRDFGITYAGIPHPITHGLDELMRGTFFVEWAAGQQAGTIALEREAVRMMASLLGRPEAAGFITSGGTESNLAAMRLARNLGSRSDPQIIAPVTMHFSFRMGAELLGIELVEIDVDDDTFLPRIEDVERAITPRTVGLVCSAPNGGLGLLDPVEAFADLAQRKGLYLHVDAAFGGFILPFMRDLGIDVGRFDLSLPGVSSIMTDGHKLGLMPIATGFFLAADPAAFEAIPTDRTLIHTTSSTKAGRQAAAAWAVLTHLGRRGYQASTHHVLELRRVIVEGLVAIEGIDLLVRPVTSIVAVTSATVDLSRVHDLLADDGWGQSYGVLRGRPYIRLSIHPSHDLEQAHAFVTAFEAAVARARAR